MSEAPATKGQTSQKAPRKSPPWVRWLLAAWWVVIAYLALSLRDTFISNLWPWLPDKLAALLGLVAGWPQWAQVGLAVLVALILDGFIWLTILAFERKEARALETAKAGHLEWVGEVREGVEPLEAEIKGARQDIEAL